MAKVYEIGGKLFEALVAYVLEKIGITFHWGEVIPGVGVESDFVLYRNGKVYMVLLVTHSSAEAGTAIKYWRNVEELFDVKALDNKNLVINVLFFGQWKEDLLKIFTKVFDASFCIADKEYATDFEERLVHDVLPLIKGQSKEDTLLAIKDQVSKNRALRELLRKFETDLMTVVNTCKSNGDLVSLWKMEKHVLGNAVDFQHEIKDTFFKWGLVKLAFLTRQEREDIYSHVLKHTPVSAALKRRVRFMQFKEDGTSINVLDKRMAYVINWLGAANTEMIIENIECKYGDKVLGYLNFARNSNSLFTFISNELPAILSCGLADGVNRILEGITDGIIKGKRNSYMENCFFVCKYLDSRFSYDVVVREGKIERGSGPNRFGGVDQLIIGSGVPSKSVIKKISTVIYSRLCNHGDLPGKAAQIVKDAIHQNFVTLIKHRSVNYLHELVALKLKNLGFSIDQYEIGFRSCISEYSQVRHNTGDPKFTFSASKDGKKYLFHVICAYSATHKHKEFPGKLRSVKCECVRRGHRIIFRKNPAFNYDEVVLLMDGIWKQLFSREGKLISAFKNSGWTRMLNLEGLLKMNEYTSKLLDKNVQVPIESGGDEALPKYSYVKSGEDEEELREAAEEKKGYGKRK